MDIKVNDRLTLYSQGGQALSTDAYLLAAYTKSGRLAAELGCGCGICSMLLSDRDKFCKIVAYELQDELVASARDNIEKNGLCDKIEIKKADVRTLAREEKFDTVVANPPYLKLCGKSSPDSAKAAARQEIFGGVAEFTACASRLLTDGGYFYCVYRPDRLSLLFSALKENRFEPKLVTFVHHNESSEASMVLVAARKGAAVSLKVTKPLILRKADGEMTPEAQEIYNTCSFKRFL